MTGNKCTKYNQCTSEVMGGKQNQVVNRTEWLFSQELTVVQYLEPDKGIILFGDKLYIEGRVADRRQA